MRHIRSLGLLLLFLAGVFSALGILALFPQERLVALTVWLRVAVFAVALLLCLAGLVVFEAGRRETAAEQALDWLRALQAALGQLDYPLNASRLRPLAEQLVSFFPEQEGWVLLCKVPGTLVRGAVLRSQYLEILSAPDGPGDPAVIESRLRDQLERRLERWQEQRPDPSRGGRELCFWMRQSPAGEAGVALALALPAASRWARRSALRERVFDTALDFLVQQLAMLQADLVNQREKLGSAEVGYRIRALVHELARELQGAFHLVSRLAEKGGGTSEALASLAAYLSRAAYWTNLFRDMPYFQDQWLPLAQKPVQLGAVLDGVLAESHLAWPELLIRLTSHSDPPVLADERLSSVFRNLIFNAASFSPPGAPLAIAVHPAGRFVSVQVADRGPGVSPEQAELIFTPGVGYDRPALPRGMGVGLTIAREIARAYGGDLLCHPRDGQHAGGCFEVLLPMQEESTCET